MPWVYLILIILAYLFVGKFIVGLLTDDTWPDFGSDMFVTVLWPLVILVGIAFAVGWFVMEILSIPFVFVEKLGRTVKKKLTRMFEKENES